MRICSTAATALAVSLALVQAGVIDHDKVVPFPASEPVSISNIAAQIYQPEIYIHNGCHPYPAVNANGDTSGGLKPTGGSDSGCKNSTLGSQDSPVTHFGHRHDWEHVIVWIDNPINLPGKILAMTPSAHSGYSTYAPPDADMVNGTSVKVEYTSSWIFINHHLEGTSHPGEFQALVMWADLTDAARLALNTTDFGSANVPMSDPHFLPKLDPFNDS